MRYRGDSWTHPADIERMWHTQDSHGQIPALYIRSTPLNPFNLIPFRSGSGRLRLWGYKSGVNLHDIGTCGSVSPYSGRDCVKSLQSSYPGLLPQSPPACMSANSAHIRQSRPDSGLGFQVTVLDNVNVSQRKCIGPPSW